MGQGKLVRDNIPQLITADGKKPITRTLEQEEYLQELDRKLDEEVAEYQTRKNRGKPLEEVKQAVKLSLTSFLWTSMENHCLL